MRHVCVWHVSWRKNKKRAYVIAGVRERSRLAAGTLPRLVQPSARHVHGGGEDQAKMSRCLLLALVWACHVQLLSALGPGACLHELQARCQQGWVWRREVMARAAAEHTPGSPWPACQAGVVPTSLRLPAVLPTFGVKNWFEGLPEDKRKPTINGFAAIVAGSTAVLVATPIEAIKVGIQTWPGSTLSGVVQRIVKKGGPLGFFTGLDAMLFASVPHSIVFYSCYQPIRSAVNHLIARARGVKCTGDEQGLGPMIAAGISDMAGMAVYMPGELVRMRMMNDPSRYSSFFQVRGCVRVSGLGTGFGFRHTLFTTKSGKRRGSRSCERRGLEYMAGTPARFSMTRIWSDEKECMVPEAHAQRDVFRQYQPL